MMIAEAGLSEQPDFLAPLFGIGLLSVGSGIAFYLALQLAVEMLTGGCQVSTINLLKLTAYVGVFCTLFGVFIRFLT